MKTTKHRWAAILLGLLTLFVSACGDSNDFNQVSGQQGNPNNGGGGNLVFVGDYLGANNFNGQIGELDLTVNSNGQASGTYTVEDTLLLQTIDINPGVYNVAGSVNLTTGSFNLSGTFPGLGNFTIAGNLPVGGNVGSYTVTVNGQTFTGNIQAASQGVPTPPPNGGGNNNGDAALFFGGNLSNFSFNPGGGYNGFNPPVDNGSLISGTITQNSNTNNQVLITLSEINLATTETTALVFGVITQDGEELVVGQTYDLVDSVETGALLSLSTSIGSSISEAWVATPGTSSGTVTVVAITAAGVELDFDFDNVVPNSEVSGNQATGSFSVSGTVFANYAPTLP